MPWRLLTVLGRLLVVLPLVLLGLAACGTSSASRSTLTIWYSTDDPVEAHWASGLVPLFERSHPHVHVEMRVYGLDDFNDKMQTALSAHVPPDLAYATPRAPGIPIYVGAHELLDLSPYAKRYGWASLLRPGLLRQYNDPFVLYRSQKEQSASVSAPVYAVPHGIAAVGIMYNRPLLTKLHVRLPRTMAQFERDAAVAKQAHDIALGLGNADGWLGDEWYLTLVNTRYSLGDLASELRLNPRFSFRRPGFTRAAQFMYRWAIDGYFTPQFGSLDAQGGIDSFFRGHTLFQLISSTEDPQIFVDQHETHIPIGIFAFPASFKGYDGVMPFSGYEGWIVPKVSKNKAGAVQWINFMLHGTAQHYLLAHGILPAVRTNPSRAPTPWQRAFLVALEHARPGIFIDAAPVPNLNATMEGNISILLQQVEPPSLLPLAMQSVYSSHGTSHDHALNSIDGEF